MKVLFEKSRLEEKDRFITNLRNKNAKVDIFWKYKRWSKYIVKTKHERSCWKVNDRKEECITVES